MKSNSPVTQDLECVCSVHLAHYRVYTHLSFSRLKQQLSSDISGSGFVPLLLRLHKSNVNYAQCDTQFIQ